MVSREPLPEVPNGGLPAQGFSHPWQSLPAATWDAIHSRFAFFGCLDAQADSRSQYYRLKMGDPHPELLQRPLEESTSALFIPKACLDWSAVNAIVNHPQLPPAFVQIGQGLQQVEDLVNGLINTLRQLGPEVAQLEAEVQDAWGHVLDTLQNMLNALPQQARNAVRAAVLNAASAVMLPFLSGNWPSRFCQ